MIEWLKCLIFGGKSHLKSYFLGAFACALLLMIAAPKPVILRVWQLFRRRDYFLGLEAFLWCFNRSFLAINDAGLRFNIGAVLSNPDRQSLFASRFLIESGDRWHSRKKLILAALEENSNDDFWLLEYAKEFSGFQGVASYKSDVGTVGVGIKYIALSNAIQAFDDFNHLVESMAGCFFLISGTFLGLVREGAFLGHDYDIDVGCYDSEFSLEELLQAVQMSEAFFLKEVGHDIVMSEDGLSIKERGPVMVVKILHRSYVTIDIFIHYQRGGAVVHGDAIHLWSNSRFELATYLFYGRPCYGPANPDRYLTENYGDWRVEKRDFDCDRDTPNLIFQQTPHAYLYLLEKITDNSDS